MKKFFVQHWKALLVVFVSGAAIAVLFFLPCPNRCAPGEDLMTIADTDIVPCRDVCGFPLVTIAALASVPLTIIVGLFQ